MALMRSIGSAWIAQACACLLVGLLPQCSWAGEQTQSASSALLPLSVERYIALDPDAPFSVNAACAAWAGLERSGRRAGVAAAPTPGAFAPLILFPNRATSPAKLARAVVGRASAEHTATTVVVQVPDIASRRALRDWLASLPVEYAEPDCDGPNFATTSNEPARGVQLTSEACWSESARAAFPNDPCITSLWGHHAIGWTPDIASRSKRRTVAVIDSGIDAQHEDLVGAIASPRRLAWWSERSSPIAGEVSDARCRGPAGCYPHGTQMAGTIAGRMNNGVGLAGVAPNSQLLPIRIARVDHGNLMRLSSIAAAIDLAAEWGADVINVSAKWPVDSRAVREALQRATGPGADPKRLVVTGYTVSFGTQDQLVEGYPSRYRYMPGVIAAAPGGPLNADSAATWRRTALPLDGPITAPGVDIVVTTTQNANGGYAVSQAAGASSAAAYTSGAIALIWGTPPLDKCGAREIKRLLFCRSRSTNHSRYPWINVDFLQEMAKLPATSSCSDALAAAGCTD